MRMKTAKALLGIGLLLGSIGVLVDPAAAATTLQFPTVVFGPKSPSTAASIPVPFNISDPITTDPRAIVINTNGADDNCPSFTYDGNPEGGCTEVQLSVNTGTVRVAVSGGSGSFQVSGGAEVLQAGGSGGTINIVGTDVQINAALTTLVYTPPLTNPNDSNDAFETFDTAGGHVFLTISPQDGDDVQYDNGEGGSSETVEIRIEGLNDAPTLAVGPNPSVPPPYVLTPDGNPNTTELETNDLVVLEDVDLEQGELDDFILVVAWVTEGRFTLRQDNGCVGAPDEIFTPGFCVDDDFDNLLAQLGPVGDLIPSGVLSELTDLAPDFTTPSQAIAFVAEHDPAVNILTRFEYFADENDCDCSFNVFATDLGNNGMPLPGPVPFVMPSNPLVLSIPLTIRDADNDAPVVTADPAGPTDVDELASVPLSFTVEDVDADCDLTLNSVSVAGGTLMGAPATPVDGSPEELTALLAGLTFTAPEVAVDPTAGSVVVNVEDNGCGPVAGDPSLTGQGVATFAVHEDGQPDLDPNPGVNDAPVVTVPAAPVPATENVNVNFVDAEIGVTDPDAAPSDLTMTITLTAGAGTLNIGPDVIPSPFVLTDDLGALNTALDALGFTPASDGDTNDTSATIEVDVDDNGNTGTGGPLSDTESFTVAVDDDDLAPANVPPTITANPSNQNVNEGDVANFAFDITDADDATVALTALVSTCGTVTGAPAVGDTDTLAALLDGLSITAPGQASCTVTATISDGEDTDSDTATFTIDQDEPPVNVAPTITANPANQSVVVGDTVNFAFDIVDPDDATITLTALTSTCGSITGAPSVGTVDTLATLLDGLSFTAPNLASCTVTATVSDGEDTDTDVATFNIGDEPSDNVAPTITANPANQSVVVGDLVSFAFDIVDPDDATVTLTALTSTCGAITGAPSVGTIDTLAALLDGLSFTAPNLASCTVSATVSDGEASDADVATFNIDQEPPVDPNETPTLTGPSSLSVVEGGQIAFTGADAITLGDDADPASQLTLDVTETGDGTVAAAAVPGSTNGTLAELQALLAGLTFTAGTPGAASITITVNDNGNTGTGGPQTASITIPITVTAAGTTTTSTSTTSTTLGATTTTTTGAVVGAGATGRGGALPRTGADLLLWAGVALVLVGFGGLLTGSRRRA